jgi:hypothetical protein
VIENRTEYHWNLCLASFERGCEKLPPIMSFNYERGGAEMLHSFGHRAESSMSKVFGGWDVNQSRHDWDRYAHNLGQTDDVAFYQCGSFHFPPNVEWIKVNIDACTHGPNPGLGEIVFVYY